MSDQWKLGMAGRGGAEAERIGGTEEQIQSHRQPEQKPADQRHSRGAQDEPGQQERLRRGRASPTPTGCTQSRQERPQGQGSPQGWPETPTATQHTLTTSTGAQERHTLPEVVRGYPLTLSRSQTHQTRHRPRQTVQGHSYPPTAPREPQPPRKIRRRCAEGARHTYMNTEEGTTAEPKTRTVQGLTGCTEKSWSDLKKVVDM